MLKLWNCICIKEKINSKKNTLGLLLEIYKNIKQYILMPENVKLFYFIQLIKKF